jgi:hypothetical protein
MRFPLFIALLVSLAGCALVEQPTRMVSQATHDWRRVATPADRERMRDWRKTFVGALADARRAGHSADIAREGALLEPDAAIANAEIANGEYRCRVIKLGAKSPGMLDYIAYPAFACRVAPHAGLQSFAKLSGSQRPVGLIFPGDVMRKVFLGTLALGDEREAMQYGQDETRNIAGYIERIGPERWRLLMPRPHFESQLDVIELVPVAGRG